MPTSALSPRYRSPAGTDSDNCVGTYNGVVAQISSQGANHGGITTKGQDVGTAQVLRGCPRGTAVSGGQQHLVVAFALVVGHHDLCRHNTLGITGHNADEACMGSRVLETHTEREMLELELGAFASEHGMASWLAASLTVCFQVCPLSTLFHTAPPAAYSTLLPVVASLVATTLFTNDGSTSVAVANRSVLRYRPAMPVAAKATGTSGVPTAAAAAPAAVALTANRRINVAALEDFML